MVLLSEISTYIDAYVRMHGNKQVLSIGTCNGGDDEFLFHLADPYDGPIGSDPFTGRDKMHVPRHGNTGTAGQPASTGHIVSAVLGTADKDVLAKACIALEYMLETASSGNIQQAVELAERIYNEMPNMDEPRFSWNDYVDGIVNAFIGEVDMEKLLALGSEDFAASLIWLARDRRETYEGRPHAQEPLGCDIWR